MTKFITKYASQSTIIKKHRKGSMVVTHTKYKGFTIAKDRYVGERNAYYIADNPHFPGIKLYDKTSHGIQTQIDKFIHGRKVRNQFTRWLEDKGKYPFKP